MFFHTEWPEGFCVHPGVECEPGIDGLVLSFFENTVGKTDARRA